MRLVNLRLEKTTMRPLARFLGIAVAAIFLLSSPPAQANVTWTRATTGGWSVASNWSGEAVPTSTDNAEIYNGGMVNINTTADVCNHLSRRPMSWCSLTGA
jgi:hypothetical protein